VCDVAVFKKGVIEKMRFRQSYTVEIFLCTSEDCGEVSNWFYMAVRTEKGRPVKGDIKVVGDTVEECIANYEIADSQREIKRGD